MFAASAPHPSDAAARGGGARSRCVPQAGAQARARRPDPRRRERRAISSAATTRRSCAPRVSTSSPSQELGALNAQTLARLPVVILARDALTDGQASALGGWVQGGGNLIAMRPDARARGPARARTGHRRPLRRLRRRSTRARAPGAGHHRRRRCSSTARPTAGRSPARRPSRRCTRTRRPRRRRPGGDAAQRRRGRRAGRRVHVRPRALGRRHAPGQPGAGRDRSATAISPIRSTTCSSAAAGRTG